MKFCPKCGSIMMIVRKGEDKIFKCSRCGYEMGIGVGEEQLYRSTVRGEQKILTTKVISRKRGLETRREEELEQAKDSFYEIVLDQMGEYGE